MASYDKKKVLKRKANTLDYFVIKSKTTKCTADTCSTSSTITSNLVDVEESGCGEEKSGNAVSGLAPDHFVQNETTAAVSSDTNLDSPAECTLSGKIKDISNLLLLPKSQIDDNLKYAVLSKDYSEGLSDYKFPVKQEGTIMRSFQFSWLVKNNWLVYSKSNYGAFCKYCMLFGKSTSHNADVGILVNRPFTKWKKALEAFKNHSASQYHLNSRLDADAFIQIYRNKTCNVQELADSSMKKKVSENSKKLISIVKTVILHGRENIPLRGHREGSCSTILEKDGNEQNRGTFNALLKFRVDAGDVILKEHLEKGSKNSLYISPRIQNELIAICGELVTEKIISEVKKSLYFSVLCDETTDIAGIEQMSICIRFLKCEKIVETFLTFVAVSSLAGENLANVILQIIENYGLDINNLRGQGYDGASNMSGKLQGVQARIKEKQPYAEYTHCCSHVLNLTIVSATNSASASRQINNMLSTIKSTTNFIRDSYKRREILKKNLSVTETNKTVLKQLCETRWIERHSALIDFVSLFGIIVKTLEEINEISTEHAMAFSLLQSILCFEFITSLVICSEISGLMMPVSRYLQKRTIDLTQAKKAITNLLNVLKNRRENVDESFNSMFARVRDLAVEHDIQPKVPRTCGRQTHRSNISQGSDVNFYYKVNVYIPFLDHCIAELETRFGPQFEKICHLQCFIPSFVVTASTQEVEQAVNSVTYPDISKFELQLETEIWKQKWEEEQGDKVPETALSSLQVCNADLFPNVRKVLEVLCVLPVTSAEPERSFSTLRRLKNWMRSTTSETRLNGLAALNIHREIDVCPEEVVERFVNQANRRMDLIL